MGGRGRIPPGRSGPPRPPLPHASPARLTTAAAEASSTARTPAPLPWPLLVGAPLWRPPGSSTALLASAEPCTACKTKTYSDALPLTPATTLPFLPPLPPRPFLPGFGPPSDAPPGRGSSAWRAPSGAPPGLPRTLRRGSRTAGPRARKGLGPEEETGEEGGGQKEGEEPEKRRRGGRGGEGGPGEGKDDSRTVSVGGRKFLICWRKREQPESGGGALAFRQALRSEGWGSGPLSETQRRGLNRSKSGRESMESMTMTK